jgi:hypothetical protein
MIVESEGKFFYDEELSPIPAEMFVDPEHQHHQKLRQLQRLSLHVMKQAMTDYDATVQQKLSGNLNYGESVIEVTMVDLAPDQPLVFRLGVSRFGTTSLTYFVNNKRISAEGFRQLWSMSHVLSLQAQEGRRYVAKLLIPGGCHD